MSKEEKFRLILDELRSSSTDILGTVLASLDGLVIAHNLATNDPHEANKLAAMSSALLGISRKVAGTLSSGQLEEINVKGSDKSILIFDVAGQSSLLLIIKKEAALGFVLLEARDKVKKLASA